MYSVVDELCQFKKVSLLITSRITTVPPRCKRPEIQTLSMEAALNIFYGLYGNSGRSGIIDDLLQRLDFHPLSITLLATTASHNTWDHNRLAEEWDTQRAQVLQTDYNESFAATIELSLTSPTFHGLGPNARDLLGVAAFFPQGIDEKNLNWLFPAISNRRDIFDKFCVLSLTYRSNGFITMLAPIRDYLCPQDPRSSHLLCATKDCYFSRLSVEVEPGKPGFGGARWIVSEDINVEYLLEVFTSIDSDGDDVWDACYHFMEHLLWHKPRQTTLRSKIEALPDDHHSKPKCLSELSELFGQVGNQVERNRLLTHALELTRRLGNDRQVAETLKRLSDVNRLLGHHEEGILHAEETLEILKRSGDTEGQTECLTYLAWSLWDDKQLDAAENIASRAIDLISETGQEYFLCQLHRVLGKIYGFKGEGKKAIYHFETALTIASTFHCHDLLFWIHFGLAVLFLDEDDFNNASTHIAQAKSHTVDNPYNLGRAMQFQAEVWCLQHRLGDSKLEALRALEIFEKLGAVELVGFCEDLLHTVEQATESRSTRSSHR